jgi:hypothetical protein
MRREVVKRERGERLEGRSKLLDIKCRRKEAKKPGELERDRSLKLALKRGNSFLAGVRFYIEIQLVLEDVDFRHIPNPIKLTARVAPQHLILS